MKRQQIWLMLESPSLAFSFSSVYSWCCLPALLDIAVRISPQHQSPPLFKRYQLQSAQRRICWSTKASATDRPTNVVSTHAATTSPTCQSVHGWNISMSILNASRVKSPLPNAVVLNVPVIWLIASIIASLSPQRWPFGRKINNPTNITKRGYVYRLPVPARFRFSCNLQSNIFLWTFFNITSGIFDSVQRNICLTDVMWNYNLKWPKKIKAALKIFINSNLKDFWYSVL